MAAIALGKKKLKSTGRGRALLGGFLRQAIFVTAALLFYLGVRRFTEGSAIEAIANGFNVLNFEAALGIDVEASLQKLIIDSDTLITFFNWIYIWGHWPVLASTFVWLYLRHRPEFILYRNSLVISGLVGLLIFAIYPVAPPRLLDIGMVDTIQELSRSYQVLQPPSMINKYAALPSFHVGWNLLVALTIFRAAKRWQVKALGVAGTFLMISAVVLTANHYIVDAVAGAAIAYGAWVIAGWLNRHNAEPTRDPDLEVCPPNKQPVAV